MDLIFTHSGRSVLRQKLKAQQKILIGRDVSCDIQLLGSDVSRTHCEITRTGKSWSIKNLSKRGTLINGDSITGETPLIPGDKINIGSFNVDVVKIRAGESPETREISIKPTMKLAERSLEENEDTIPNIQLVIPERPPHNFSLKQDITIGKHPDCKIKLDDPFVSHWHCSLSWGGNLPIIKDSGSTNGTFVGGKKISRVRLDKKGAFKVGKTEIQYKLEDVDDEKDDGPFIGKNPRWQTVLAQLKQVSALEVSVCLLGESGTGKELAAKFLHENSNRKNKPFVAMNCGAIPETLIEGLLFGHEKGAFTGATEKHTGVFEQADNGTLFLDEIAELSPELQTRLLRVLETKVVRRVGGKEEKKVDFRLVTATNKELSQEVIRGRFREDLFHRIFVFPVFLPPLRDRGDDIILLAEHFLQEFSPTGTHKFTEAAAQKLRSYTWPGNVRELKNTIQRTLINVTGENVDADDVSIYQMPRNLFTNKTEKYKDGTLFENERQMLEAAVNKYNGNLTFAAEQLGIARSTLRAKLEKYGMR